MDLGLAVPIIVGGLLITPTTAALNGHRKDWFTYWSTGEYNLDDNPDTVDWCEMKSGQTGKWSLVKIQGYDSPWNPSGGGVEFYTKDEFDQEHRNYWRLSKWAEGKESRRGVSINQKKAIRCAGNNWPAPAAKECIQFETFLDHLEADVNKEVRVINVQEALKSLEKKVDTALKDNTTSLNRVGGVISNNTQALKKLDRSNLKNHPSCNCETREE